MYTEQPKHNRFPYNFNFVHQCVSGLSVPGIPRSNHAIVDFNKFKDRAWI